MLSVKRIQDKTVIACNIIHYVTDSADGQEPDSTAADKNYVGIPLCSKLESHFFF